ncbi:hypothetical protein SAMN02799630_02065 [Paenibacillus sp. UNCCL117]|uniref:hypothetical protein n=1 Tax=unclassified Paenibacillus TaxID=185978 RepID=UPI0008851BA2|nr:MULTISPECIES: hypothetical protein [unclassified Paenibacillus]SDD02223.1 hypothetical protein SAMN04488602_10562 [Paenibacillus sp. cl123]SFW32531.1 hypothetical protein SAMN02799630_02065 [Paenibacillus sp. UNCCL117]
MGRDILDISVTHHQPGGEATLVLECFSSAAYGLSDVPNDSSVTLKNGSKEQKLRIRRGEGDECAFPYLEVDPAAAKSLGLQDKSRYLADYNSMQDTLTLTRITVSRSQAVLETDRHRKREPRIVVGAALAAALGIPWTSSTVLTVRSGAGSMKARLVVPENEISEELRLPAFLSGKLGLSPGAPVPLAYNQKTKTLAIGDAAAALAQEPEEPAPRPVKSSRTKSHRSGQASLSGKGGSGAYSTIASATSHKVSVPASRTGTTGQRVWTRASRQSGRERHAGSQPAASAGRRRGPAIWLSPLITHSR